MAWPSPCCRAHKLTQRLPAHILEHPRGQNINPLRFLAIAHNLFSLTVPRQGAASQKLLNHKARVREFGEGEMEAIPAALAGASKTHQVGLE